MCTEKFWGEPSQAHTDRHTFGHSCFLSIFYLLEIRVVSTENTSQLLNSLFWDTPGADCSQGWSPSMPVGTWPPNLTRRKQCWAPFLDIIGAESLDPNGIHYSRKWVCFNSFMVFIAVGHSVSPQRHFPPKHSDKILDSLHYISKVLATSWLYSQPGVRPQVYLRRKARSTISDCAVGLCHGELLGWTPARLKF